MVNSTVTFQDKNGQFEVTCSSDFNTKCSNPSEHDMETLAKKYEFYKFLHNPNGPAIRCTLPGKENNKVYVVNGKFFPPDTEEGKAKIAEIESKKQFNITFDEIIK